MAILTGTAGNNFAGFPETAATSSEFKELDGMVKGISGALSALESIVSYTQKFEPSFTEDGFYEAPSIIASGVNVSSEKIASQRRQITQRPKATVFIKKKQFASLASNNEVRLLDSDEKMYLRCVKSLFRRKCDQIAFHEGLINISSIYETNGFLITDEIFNGALDSMINVFGSITGVGGILSSLISSTSLLGGGGIGGIGDPLVGFIQTLYRAKLKNERSKASAFTRWVDDPSETDFSGLGPGTGTIEFNMASSLNTSCGLSGGDATLSIEDPYQLMLITASDIESAIRTSTSQSNTLSTFFDGTASFRLALAMASDRKLNTMRKARKIKEINFEFIDGEPAAVLGFIDASKSVYYQWTKAITSADVKEAKLAGISPEEITLINQTLTHLREYRDASSVSKSGLSSFIGDIANGFVPNEQEAIKVSKLRERMRRDFLGQHIVQPMDQVTIFANSNTYDITPTGGLVDVLTGAATNLTDTLDAELIRQEGRDIMNTTGTEGVGDFALNLLYSTIRKKNNFRDDGACIFSGLAQDVSDDYDASSGSFHVSVSCQPNTHYLEISRFTLKPDLNNTFGVINDPLTPFELDGATDPATGLIIKETLELSQSNMERLEFLRIPGGPLVSQKMKNAGDILSDKRNGLAIISHTPGLTYKWKEGIVSATVDQSGGGGAFGGFSSLDRPFAKLDAANIASILITGQPYDYATFLEGVSKVSGTGADPTNLSRDFFNYLFEYTDKVKKYYGNFIPAKDRSLDRDTVMAYYQIKNAASALNIRANKKITQLAGLQRQLDSSSSPTSMEDLKKDISAISEEIAQLQKSLLPSGVQLSLEGNNAFLSLGGVDTAQSDRDITYKVKRKPEDVRFNQDNNYFIVSSSYDTEFLVQAFAANLGNFSTYDADYSDPLNIIKAATSALQLEFFADPDGNLILRPPRYNRTPLSLMLEIIRQMPPGEDSFLPKFVKNLLLSRNSGIKEAILKNELNIAKDLYSLGLESSVSQGKEGKVFPFIKPMTQMGGSIVYQLDEAAVDDEMRKIFSPPSPGADPGPVFGPLSRVVTLGQVTSGQTISANGAGQAVSRLADVLFTIRSKNGEAADDALRTKTTSEANSLLAHLGGSGIAAYTMSKLTAISGYLNTRRTLIRSLYDTLKRANAATVSPGGQAASAVTSMFGTEFQAGIGSLISTFTGSSGMPPGLEELVENDLTNLDGPGSGKRFIINDSVVIRGRFTHQPPEFNSLIVTGAIDFLSPDDGKIKDIPATTAGATDFDSWRQYGFREGSPLRRPDMTSADVQCAPFASLMLATQRKKIHSGNITVAGNEYYRPGDNVYLSYRNMVYYVTSVRHSLNLNDGSFTTDLELSYGRPPGEIIPTPIDIVGSAPSGTSFLTKKYRKAGSEDKNSSQVAGHPKVIQLGTIHVPPMLRQRAKNGDESVGATILKTNSRAIKNAVLKARARSVMSPSSSGNPARIEIRGYYLSSENQGVFPGIASQKVAQNICDVILNAFSASLSGGGSAPADTSGDNKAGGNGQAAPTPAPGTKSLFKIDTRVIDLAADTPESESYDLPFPSEEAWVSASPVEFSVAGSSSDSKIDKKLDLPVNAFDIVIII